MKAYLLAPLLLLCLATLALAAEPTSAAAPKPGRYILIMHSEKPGYSPEPVIVQVRAGATASEGLSIEAEEVPRTSWPMQPEGIGLAFSITLPRYGELLAPDANRPSARFLHFFAAQASKSRPNCVEGVFSEFRPYYQTFNPPPEVSVGTFLLFPIGTK